MRIVSGTYLCLWTLWVGLGLSLLPQHAHALALEALIANIQKAYEQTPAFTADFVQVSTLTSIQRQQTSSGRLYIEKPHAIRWEYTQPEAQTILYDGTVLRIYTPRRHQLLQNVVDASQRSNVALLFLAGVGNLRDAFIVTELPNTDAGMASLHLQPRSPQASFAELQVAVNAHSYFVERLLIQDHIGNLTEIRLSALQVAPSLPQHTFDFTPPPGTEIITPPRPEGQR